MIIKGYILPGKPQPLIAPEKSPAWTRLKQGFEKVRKEIEESEADLLLLYSSQWLSVIGHQIQAHPRPEWVLVDEEWHEMGEISYQLRMDPEFAHRYEKMAQNRGLHARTIAYEGFPIDPGTVTVLKLINPDNRLPASVVSCNMYADRAETMVLGKAAADACKGKKAIAIAVTSLSNRYFFEEIDPREDRIHSQKDDEWNRKILEFLGEGRLEDVSQLTREFSRQAHGDQKLKAIWWLAASMGQHNRYRGDVIEYQPVFGTGAALVGLTPSEKENVQKEFDEEEIEVFRADSGVLKGAKAESFNKNAHVIETQSAPRPVGAYPHARKEGQFIFVSGIGPRQAGSNEIPGGPVRDQKGKPLEYDIQAQTRAVIENIKTILEDAGSSLDRVVDVAVYLIDMDRDFKGFNEVYAEYFKEIQATRTTVAVSALPTPIAVEFKVIAKAMG